MAYNPLGSKRHDDDDDDDASRFQIGTIVEIKCNSDAFLLKIHQGIAKKLKILQTTDYGEIRLYILPGSILGIVNSE